MKFMPELATGFLAVIMRYKDLILKMAESSSNGMQTMKYKIVYSPEYKGLYSRFS